MECVYRGLQVGLYDAFNFDEGEKGEEGRTRRGSLQIEDYAPDLRRGLGRFLLEVHDRERTLLQWFGDCSARSALFLRDKLFGGAATVAGESGTGTTRHPVAEPTWTPVAVDWQDTQLGPGFPEPITSAWSDVGVLRRGHVLRIEADGFNGTDSKIAKWGWYLNLWSGDGRHWTTTKGADEPSRVLHFNPRPRAGYVAMNTFLRGEGWGKEMDVPVPAVWKQKNHASPFVLEVEVGVDRWIISLNGEPQPALAYVRDSAGLASHLAAPLVLQVYDLINPRISIKLRGKALQTPTSPLAEVIGEGVGGGATAGSVDGRPAVPRASSIANKGRFLDPEAFLRSCADYS